MQVASLIVHPREEILQEKKMCVMADHDNFLDPATVRLSMRVLFQYCDKADLLGVANKHHLVFSVHCQR